MSTRLVILGLLRERPIHGYDIKRVVEDQMSDWASITSGSIYFALDMMAKEGFIEQVGTEREGGRPPRSLYQITESGRAEFHRLLREVWSGVGQPRYAIDLGLFFMNDLSREEVVAQLKERVTQLRTMVYRAATHRSEVVARKEKPRQAAAVFDHSLAHIQAELAWTLDLLSKVERGEYP